MAFAKTLRGGDVVLLHGELGAGKTTFVKGIAQGLGVKETVTSPTFMLMGVYPTMSPPRKRGSGKFSGSRIAAAASGMTKSGRSGMTKQLCHIDTYRLKNVDELRAIGAEEYIGDPHTITVIEWPEKIASLLRGKKTKNIFFTHVDGGRSIAVR